MLSLVTVSPVITAFHSCCLSHQVFAGVNLSPVWVGIETAIFWQCSPGTVETQRLYPLRHGLGSLLITWRRPEEKFGPYVVKKKQQKNYQDEDKKSAVDEKKKEKLILRLRSLISKGFPIKTITKSVLIRNWISWIRIAWLNWIAWNRIVFNN